MEGFPNGDHAAAVSSSELLLPEPLAGCIRAIDDGFAQRLDGGFLPGLCTGHGIENI
jgi:hypothetical protein